MVKLQDQGRGDYKLLPENEVVMARLADVSENSFTDPKDGGEVLNYRWKFTMEGMGPDFDGKDIDGQTSRIFSAHPSCKSYNWVTQLMGALPDVEAGIDTDMLIGKPCRILVGHRKDKQGRIWMTVKEVLPPRGAAIVLPEEAPF